MDVTRWISRALLILIAAAGASSAVHAEAPEMPPLISPLRVQPDINGVNIVTGRISINGPVLSVPGSRHLKFDKVQNAAPYVRGNISGGSGEYSQGSYTVHVGTGGSEAFECIDFDCKSVVGTGSTLNGRIFRQAGTGAVYRFSVEHVDTDNRDPNRIFYYAGQVSYPDGEVISYEYDPTWFNQLYYWRPTKLSSNLGYQIDISYQADTDPSDPNWANVKEASLYKSGTTPVLLGRLTYGTDGTIRDLGGRVYRCSGCGTRLGTNVGAAEGSLTLPGETSPTLVVTKVSVDLPVVASVMKDGIQWNYAYTNLRWSSLAQDYIYDRLTVSGPNGYRQIYDMKGAGTTGDRRRNEIEKVTDSIGRTVSFELDDASRVTRIVYPEGNEVRVSYDEFGNVDEKATEDKAGIQTITEKAFFANAGDLCTSTLCYRPKWIDDGRNARTDFLYNDDGQLTGRTDPADAAGVRRKTFIEYETGGTSPYLRRRRAVRVCGTGAACGTNAELRTEYDYWRNTFLPSVERRIDGATGAVLETRYTYDDAGRVLSIDGPLPGADDALHYRYDVHGRKVWEIGALGANGRRLAKRYDYRDSDDQVEAVEAGTIAAAAYDDASPALTVITRTDFSYGPRRNPTRQRLSSGGTTYSVVDKSYRLRGELECEAVRMNLASLPTNACTLGIQGTFGPDRITRNSYDAAGQLLKVERAYGAPLRQDYATYSYTPNGQRKSVTDANGNRAELRYDGFDRQSRWVFPSKTVKGAVNEADYEAYTYDNNGNRLTLRKRDGSTLGYSYDNLNRLVRKTVPERSGLSSTYTRDVFYGYDARDLQTYARFDSVSGEGVTNAYDGFGRLTRSTRGRASPSPTCMTRPAAAPGRSRR